MRKEGSVLVDEWMKKAEWVKVNEDKWETDGSVGYYNQSFVIHRLNVI